MELRERVERELRAIEEVAQDLTLSELDSQAAPIYMALGELRRILALIREDAKPWDGPFPEGEPWIGVDLDGTLARYDGWVSPSHIGEPILAVLDMVKEMRTGGQNVAIFTARASVPSQRDEAIPAIESWCREHVGEVLPITYRKDYGMIACYDDRATQVVRNDGRPYEHPDYHPPDVERLRGKVAALEKELATYGKDVMWVCFGCGAEFSEDEYEAAAVHFGMDGSKKSPECIERLEREVRDWRRKAERLREALEESNDE